MQQFHQPGRRHLGLHHALRLHPGPQGQLRLGPIRIGLRTLARLGEGRGQGGQLLGVVQRVLGDGLFLVGPQQVQIATATIIK